MDTQRHVHQNSERLAEGVARRLIALWRGAPRNRVWHLALAGGRTPRGVYDRLRRGWRDMDWSTVEVWFGDERDVPPEHPQSNFRMARETLLDHVPVPREHVHPLRSRDLDLRRDCARYARLLAARLPHADGWPVFDVILLGLGTDGHTASLFPDTCILRERQQTVAPVYVPRLGAWRMSLTLPVLEHAARLLFVVSGADKADVLRRAWDPAAAAQLPVGQLRPAGAVEWHVDQAAVAGTPELEPPA